MFDDEFVKNMNVPESLDRMIIWSLSKITNEDLWKKISKNITLVGGGCLTGAARDSTGKCLEPSDFLEILEDNLNKILKSSEYKELNLEEGISITKIWPD